MVGGGGDRVKGEAGALPHLGGNEKLLLLGPPQPRPGQRPQMAAMRQNVDSAHTACCGQGSIATQRLGVRTISWPLDSWGPRGTHRLGPGPVSHPGALARPGHCLCSWPCSWIHSRNL